MPLPVHVRMSWGGPPPGGVKTQGVEAAARPLLRSIRHRSLPVVLSSATSDAVAPSWSLGTISRSSTTIGDAPAPCSLFHGPISYVQSSLPVWSAAWTLYESGVTK